MTDINLLLGATKVDLGEEYGVMYKVGDKAYSEKAYLILLAQATLGLAPLEQKEECFNLIVEKLKQNNEFPELNEYIERLPGELRLKYIELYDFDKYNSYSTIVEGITNDEIVYNILIYALNQTENTFDIKKIFSLVPSMYKIEFLNLISEKEKIIQKNIIYGFEMSEFLLDFNIEQRPYIIKEIFFKKFKHDYESEVSSERIIEYVYKDILKTIVEDNVPLKDSKIYDVLLFMIEETKKRINKVTNKPEKIYRPSPIIKIFLENGYDIKEIIKVLIDKDAVDFYTLVNVNKELPDNIKKDITKFTIDYCINQGKKLNDECFYNFIGNLNRNDCIELFYKYVIKENVYDYEYVLKETKKCLFYANQLFSLMTKKEIDENFERINAAILLNEATFNFKPEYEIIIKIYSEKYNINYSGLYKFIQNFGFATLKYLGAEKIRNYINLPSDKLEKLLKIFNNNNLYFDKSIKNDIINSLYQREFMMKEKDIYNIFSRFEILIANNDLLGVKNLLEFIQQSYDINLILAKNNITYEEFYHRTMNGNLDILHQITDRFIAFKREEYIREKLVDVDNFLIMDKVISRESYKKDYALNHSYMIGYNLNNMDKSLFSNEQLVLIENREILDEIINFKRDPKGYLLKNEYRKYLKTFNELLDLFYDNKVDFFSYDPNREDQKHLVFVSVQQKIDPNYLLGILLESNYDGIYNVIDDDNLYEKLLDFLYKYKILGWQYTFNDILESCQMDFNEGTLAGLLSNFDKIVDKIENKATLTSVIDYSNCYSSSSKVYSLLFGRENFNLIAANSGKNKASMSKKNRLSKNTDLINKMYQRKYITTPTINETLSLENGKNIDVVLGNSTNMMNLTYGERTNSCMRQGGAFNDLFHYCIENENGFHIRFSNPKTGNFVSRVSGLRNGNTIFLNELRVSLDEEYTNEDLYAAIKEVAEYLINVSKDSKVPIDNVLITTDYALEFKKDEEQELGLTKEERQNALQKINFNFANKGLLLATSNYDNSIAKYNFDIELPKYDVERDNIKIYKGQSAIERITQLKIINHLLNGGKLDDINVENITEQPDYLVSGEDFYIAFKNGETNIFVLDKSKENIKTKEEIEKILNTNYNFEDNQIRRISL